MKISTIHKILLYQTTVKPEIIKEKIKENIPEFHRVLKQLPTDKYNGSSDGNRQQAREINISVESMRKFKSVDEYKKDFNAIFGVQIELLKSAAVPEHWFHRQSTELMQDLLTGGDFRSLLIKAMQSLCQEPIGRYSIGNSMEEAEQLKWSITRLEILSELLLWAQFHLSDEEVKTCANLQRVADDLSVCSATSDLYLLISLLQTTNSKDFAYKKGVLRYIINNKSCMNVDVFIKHLQQSQIDSINKQLIKQQLLSHLKSTLIDTQQGEEEFVAIDQQILKLILYLSIENNLAMDFIQDLPAEQLLLDNLLLLSCVYGRRLFQQIPPIENYYFHLFSIYCASNLQLLFLDNIQYLLDDQQLFQAVLRNYPQELIQCAHFSRFPLNYQLLLMSTTSSEIELDSRLLLISLESCPTELLKLILSANEIKLKDSLTDVYETLNSIQNLTLLNEILKLLLKAPLKDLSSAHTLYRLLVEYVNCSVDMPKNLIRILLLLNKENLCIACQFKQDFVIEQLLITADQELVQLLLRLLSEIRFQLTQDSIKKLLTASFCSETNRCLFQLLQKQQNSIESLSSLKKPELPENVEEMTEFLRLINQQIFTHQNTFQDKVIIDLTLIRPPSKELFDEYIKYIHLAKQPLHETTAKQLLKIMCDDNSPALNEFVGERLILFGDYITANDLKKLEKLLTKESFQRLLLVTGETSGELLHRFNDPQLNLCQSLQQQLSDQQFIFNFTQYKSQKDFYWSIAALKLSQMPKSTIARFEIVYNELINDLFQVITSHLDSANDYKLIFNCLLALFNIGDCQSVFTEESVADFCLLFSIQPINRWFQLLNQLLSKLLSNTLAEQIDLIQIALLFQLFLVLKSGAQSEILSFVDQFHDKFSDDRFLSSLKHYIKQQILY